MQKAIETSVIRSVRFDAKALSSWDSSILIFLTKVTEHCRQRDIVTEERPPVTINYKFHSVNKEWNFYDLAIEDISVVNNYRSRSIGSS